MNIRGIESPFDSALMQVTNLASTLQNNMTRLDRQPIKSAWKLPVGKKLTDAIINKRAKEGWYGHAAKEAALSGSKVHSTNGFVDRCQGQEGTCGETRGVKHFSYKYLAKPMFLCPTCLMTERSKAIKRKETEKTFKRNMDEFI